MARKVRILQIITFISLFLGFFSLPSSASVQSVKKDTTFNPLFRHLQNEYVCLRQNKLSYDSIIYDKQRKVVRLYLNKIFEGIPFREEVVNALRDSVIACLPESYSRYKAEVYINSYEIEDLIPNIYREENSTDKGRLEKNSLYEHPFVSNLSKPYQPTKGLLNNNIALWPSHGWYFDPKTQEWKWQRPRLFSIAEDTYTLGYVLPYITPMLENAGAYVMLPRERDTQLNEVIVDNDERQTFLYEECHDKHHRWRHGDSSGFANPKQIYIEGENPFCYGTYRQIPCNKEGMAYASWTPDIPEEGDYAVYVSYHSLPNSTTRAHYTVYHTGGTTQFVVNQKMGGGTWIYLGTFHFDKGTNPDHGQVELSNKGESSTIVTADAVRFGGGYSNIGRTMETGEVQTGNKPRYLEGARYWLQWAGFPDSIYNRQGDMDDYKDDYMSRGHWVNHLIGGSSKSLSSEGLSIPIEMAMGLHTDAGQLFNDSIYGTLAIYMSESNGKRVYANGQRRIVSRDLADIIQTEVVNDIRRTYREDWTRRKMTDASYYEARVPEVPTMLLELLSHQNFTDMRYGLDPHFKFTVSRAIYKAILKFIAYQQDRDYIVQPLPIQCFSADFTNAENNVLMLNWTSQSDSLEPTAVADHYILYTSIDGSGWDNGEVIHSNSAFISLEANRLYRFMVTAVNDGGESFPSEILAAGYVPQSPRVALIVNGFHRVSAPAWYDTEGYSGFLENEDQGVPDRYDLSYTGAQYGFNKKVKFHNNVEPGHGASHGIFENDKIAGNTFDFPAVHGKALLNAGYSFTSYSDEAFMKCSERSNPFRHYKLIDLILGEEKSTQVGNETRYQLFSEPMRKTISQYLNRNKGNIFVSGAYVASDLFERDSCDDEAIRFATRTLKYQLAESRVTEVKGVLSNYFSPFTNFKNQYYHYCRIQNPYQYAVELPDAIDTAHGSKIVFSFEGCNLPAAVGYKGKYKTLISSIPFESIESEEERMTLMKEIIEFFEK